MGIVNGLAITRLKVLPFIGTLGMLGIARGVAKWLANQQTVNAPETWVNELAVTFPTPSWLLVAPGVWISLVLAVAATFLLQQTVFGRRVFAVGSNEAAARACGVQTDRLKVWIYGLAGLLFGLSGVMQMSRLRQGDPTVAIGTELDVIAAVVIGGGSLSGGEGTIAGSLIGALVMAFLRNGSQQMGWPNYVQEIIIGVIIVLAVAADRARRAKAVAGPTRRRPARRARPTDRDRERPDPDTRSLTPGARTRSRLRSVTTAAARGTSRSRPT